MSARRQTVAVVIGCTGDDANLVRVFATKCAATTWLRAQGFRRDGGRPSRQIWAAGEWDSATLEVRTVRGAR